MSRGTGPGAPLRLAMVGGGEGAYIGGTHRLAARQADAFTLVAGAFDVDPERGRRFGAALGLTDDRLYATAAELARAEAGRADGADAVAICTPNHTHYPLACACLEAGLPVICEKPLTTTLADARALQALAAERDLFVGTCYTYSAYPLVHQARALVASGAIGAVRLVQVEYQHQWMARAVEADGNPQAAWRTDPAQSGAGGAVADIGCHAFHLAGFVSGLAPERLLADAFPVVPGRRLDDAGTVLLRYPGGARGVLTFSQVSPGCANGVRVRVFGEEGGLDWHQERPNELIHSPLDGPPRILWRGGADLAPTARARSVTPPGHAEGYLEAFANLYAGFAEALRSRREGRPPSPIGIDGPTIADGVAGVAFIEAVVASSAAAAEPVWVDLPAA
jgi:predicted dehydrogenase